MTKSGSFLFAAIVMGFFASHGAQAAPQALALFASNAPIPLDCADGLCSAELTSFCLQPGRHAPVAGTAYRPAEGQEINLVVVDRENGERRVGGNEYVDIRSKRGYWALTISIPEDALVALRATRVAVEILERTSLLPVAVAGDPNPQTKPEIAAATGYLREIGAAIVDHGAVDAQVVRIISRLINALPARGRPDSERLAQIWRSAVGATGAGEDEPAAVRTAETFGRCQETGGTPFGHFSLRSCLERQHGLLVNEMTERYWDAFRGS